MRNLVVYSTRIWFYSVIIATPIWFLFWNKDDSSLVIAAPVVGLFYSFPAYLILVLSVLLTYKITASYHKYATKAIFSILCVLLNYLTFDYTENKFILQGFITQSILSILFVWVFEIMNIGVIQRNILIFFTSIIATVMFYKLVSFWINL